VLVLQGIATLAIAVSWAGANFERGYYLWVVSLVMMLGATLFSGWGWTPVPLLNEWFRNGYAALDNGPENRKGSHRLQR